MREWGFMLPSHTVGLLDGRTVPHHHLLCRSQLKWLQDLTVSRKCYNPFHNQLPFLLCCSSLLSYPQSMSSTARVQITFKTDSICHSVWEPCYCHVRVLVQRSPPAHVWPEPSSLRAQAAPHSPRQHIKATQVNTARHSRKFQEKTNSYI